MTEGESASTGPVVYTLGSGATVEELAEEQLYLGEVNGVVPYGVFVDLNDRISGLVHESNLPRQYGVGEEIVVKLESIQPNGDIAFEGVEPAEFEVVPLDVSPEPLAIADIDVGMDDVAVEGRVDQINQTAGPTVFSVCDGASVIPCAAFEAAGVRAFPDVERGDLVRILGTPERHADGFQLEVDAVTVLVDEEAESARTALEERTAERIEPASVEPLVDWPAIDRLRPGLENLARDLRRAIIESRPVQIRHHADGDGMCAAVPVRLALERFAESVHHDASAPQYLVSRSPAKAPFYEMEDATRDLNHALKDRDRHGQRLPILLMLDNGSTAEDVPAYRNLAHYDISIAVVDHHHPDPDAVGDLLDHHVNPYLEGEDYRVTTGMLCVELARMIDPALTDSIAHVPAVAGMADRSAANAMDEYLALADRNGYGREDIRHIGDALDYAAHWLKFRSGDVVVRDILGVGADTGPQRPLIEHLATVASEAIDAQVSVATPHLRSERLPNGAQLHRLDVDAHAYRFRYPAPGKTTGAIHDAQVTRSGEPTVTLGFGPDFCVLRSDGVRLDIPKIVADMQAELPGAGVSGGGHLVVGSIKFVSGRRDAVLERLIDHLGSAPLDEELTSAGTILNGDE